VMVSSKTQKLDLLEFGRQQLVDWLAGHGIEAYRADQILRWIYVRQVDDFDAMTDLSRSVRDLLGENFTIRRLPVVKSEQSADGSRKYLLRLSDGRHIESVLIPERGHSTLCVSSQAGCAQGCRFCRTGEQGLERHLTRGEIIAQVRDIISEPKDYGPLTNIVFMGMGEPLANYRNLAGALKTITDGSAGLGFSRRRVTVSTAGLVPRLVDLGRDTGVNLAVSLNAADNETRSRLMPINRRYPLEVLLDACRKFPLPSGRRITFEYILLAGVNDSATDARRLARVLHGLKVKINLIPFNEYPGCCFRRPSEEAVARFQHILLEKNYTAVIRRSKGADINAACGQRRAAGVGGGSPGVR